MFSKCENTSNDAYILEVEISILVLFVLFSLVYIYYPLFLFYYPLSLSLFRFSCKITIPRGVTAVAAAVSI